MRWCAFLCLLGSVAAWSHGAQGQQAGKVWRIGLLHFGTASAYANRVARLRVGLRELGYVDGANFVIEARWADNNYDQLPALAAELVNSNVDVIVTSGTPSVLAAKRATATVPIVMAVIGDPVAAGAVASLARPGGNITGQSFFAPELAAKRMDLLKEILPRMARVAYLTNLDNPIVRPTIGIMEAAAKSINIAMQPVSVRVPHEFAGAFDFMAQNRIPALVFAEDGFIAAHYAQLANLAARYGLVSAGSPEAARVGATIGYGVDNTEMFGGAAIYIDKIFKGARPADLPIQQATKFQFVLNQKAAMALNLDIPIATKLRADEVIE